MWHIFQGCFALQPKPRSTLYVTLGTHKDSLSQLPRIVYFKVLPSSVYCDAKLIIIAMWDWGGFQAMRKIFKDGSLVKVQA
jgi:hypothetical protein